MAARLHSPCPATPGRIGTLSDGSAPDQGTPWSHRASAACPRTAPTGAPRPVTLPRRADTEPTWRPGRPAPTRPRAPAVSCARTDGRREEPGL